MNRNFQNKSGRKQRFFFLILLLLSACFFSCQFTPLLDLDSSSETSSVENSGIPSVEIPTTPSNETAFDSQNEESLPMPDDSSMQKYYNPLTGLQTDKSAASVRPIAVCIGNTTASLPQYGLSFADVLIEAPVEGGSTRLMAITQKYKEIACYGSIRSTREYFQLFAKNFDAISIFAGTEDTSEKQYYQCGESLDYISQNLTTTFYRDTRRQSPHNLMTSGALISITINDSGYRQSASFALPYQIAFNSLNSVTTRTLSANTVELPFSSLQNVKFTYNASLQSYYRFQNGIAHMDATSNTQLSFKNLILIFCNSSTQQNASGESTLSMSLSGSGTAFYISGGLASEIAWKKDDASSNITFYDSQGKQLTISPGNTYIGVLKSSSIESVVIK